MNGWHPIKTAPHDGTLVLVTGFSGYIRHRRFVTAAYYDAEYRPLSPWQSVTNDSLSDHGWEPTHWRPMMELPE